MAGWKILVVVPLLADFGCQDRLVAPAEPETSAVIVEEIFTNGISRIDILFVIDSAPTMEDEQDTLAEQLELMAREIVAPSWDPDEGLEDVHLGVITSDLGAGGYDGSDGCTGDGDDGRLLGGWLSHEHDHLDDGTDPDDLPIWEDLARTGGGRGMCESGTTCTCVAGLVVNFNSFGALAGILDHSDHLSSSAPRLRSHRQDSGLVGDVGHTHIFRTPSSDGAGASSGSGSTCGRSGGIGATMRG